MGVSPLFFLSKIMIKGICISSFIKYNKNKVKDSQSQNSRMTLEDEQEEMIL